MSLPVDYIERVYAGVLGKLIGVYLGRPLEQAAYATYEQIVAELGYVDYYVNDRLPERMPLVLPDDDLSGTFTFLRALPDHDCRRDLTSEQIGQTWLNYLIEGRTILWWSGLGHSTEHTAYLRLKHGIPAPRSGSMALNSQIVAEQIGAEIFVDGWAMVAPGDPELAADFARRAGSVSHDGEAVYGAQVIAAMEAQAFVEADIDRLLDTGLRFIPADSTIARVNHDLREWHALDGDWEKTRTRLAGKYDYDRYGGPVHVVPNHAIVILSLLYGEGDFRRSLTIANTCGHDTDCNSGNLGCLLGIRNGLAAFEGGPDWRGPMADRLYISAADGGGAITDAVIQTYRIANIGRALAGEPPVEPKSGARFHFELPGSVQGFRVEAGEGGTARLENTPGHSRLGERSLEVHWAGSARLVTPTFIPPDDFDIPGYYLTASPTLYSGQTLRAGLSAGEGNAGEVTAQFSLSAYGPDDLLVKMSGPAARLKPGEYTEVACRVPDTGGGPIAEVGFELAGIGTLYLDYLAWEGAPSVRLGRPAGSRLPWPGPRRWERAWVNGVDQWTTMWREPYRLAQNEGRGLLIQGTREWTDYQVSVQITPSLAEACGLGARVQGMRRYYALLLCARGRVRLVKMLDSETVLAEASLAWETWKPYDLRLQVEGSRLRAWVGQEMLFDVSDDDQPLTGGGVALVIEEGTLIAEAVVVGPVS